MQITVCDKNLKKLTALNNDFPQMLSFSADTWHRYREDGVSTFDLTVSKFRGSKLHEDIGLITDDVYLKFNFDGDTHIFAITNIDEDDFSLKITSNSTLLEFTNELANPFESTSAQTIAWYMEKMELLGFAGAEIGLNEISGNKRTLKFDSQETKLARLKSLISQFDAEFEIKTQVNKSGSFKCYVINIYHEADDSHHGIGKVRGDVTLRYGRDVKGVQRTVDKTQLFNMGIFTGANGLNMGDYVRSDKDENGEEEFYTRKGNIAVYAPKSARMYPATLRDGDNWTRKDFQTEYTNVNDLGAYAFRTLKAYSYPLVTYTASIQSNFLANYGDLALGDTVKIYDDNFNGGLILTARISEQIISFSNPNNNSLVFSNYKKLKSQISPTLQTRMKEIVEASIPYTIKVATDNGVGFKNGQGQSVVTPTLMKGNKVISSGWRWVIDGVIKSTSPSYIVKAGDINQTMVLTIAAWIDNKEVVSEQITFINVVDGVAGAKGDKGDVGPRGPQGERGLQGIQGLQGPKGDQGIAGEKGADGRAQYTHIAYADTVSGSGFSQTDQNKAYIGMYQDFNVTDSKNPADYRWSKWKGSDGAQGIPGKPGADGRTPYIHFAYSDNADGTGLTVTDNGQRYQGYYSDYTQADSTDKTKYKWVDRWAKIEVGGRNLAQKTSKEWSLPYTDFKGIANTCPDLYKILIDGLAVGDTLKSRIVLKYTDVVPASGQTASVWLQGSGDVTVWNTGRYNDSSQKIISGSGEVVFEHEFKITADHLKNKCWYWQLRTDYIASGLLQWKLAKVESGTVFTNWSPALEDVRADIDSKADQVLTQEQLNALNEKAGIIQAELEAKASMDTVSKWFADFQKFVKEDAAGKAQSEKDLLTLTQRIEVMNTEFGNKVAQWSFLDNYMRAGNGGMVIGKKDGSSSVRVSDNRISFYSAGQEVAYISGGVLRIDNGVFTKTLQIGRFREEQYHINPDMNVIRYVGGN